jgi:hypothetical protein
LLELGADLLERKSHFLGNQDEGQPTDVGADEHPLAARRPPRGDQTLIIVIADRGDCETGAPGDVANVSRPLFVGSDIIPQKNLLTSSSLEKVAWVSSQANSQEKGARQWPHPHSNMSTSP